MSLPTGLRPRVTLLVAAAVICALGASFVAVYRGTATKLEHSVDAGLRADMEALRSAVGTGTTGEMARRAGRYIAGPPSRATVQVTFVTVAGYPTKTSQPELLNPSGDPDDTPAERRQEAVEARRVLGAPVGFSDRRLPGVGAVRVLVERAGSARLGVAEPLGPVEDAERSVAEAFLVAGLLGLAVALVGGLLVASRVAAPLRRMARVAARVDGGDLTPRMGLRGRPDEIQMLAHSFDQMLDRLQDAFARQSEFVADASHELRTPLAIVRGQLEVLAMSDHPSVAEIRHVEGQVRTEVDRMTRLVDDLVVLVQAGEEEFLHVADVDVRSFLAGLCDGLRATTDRRLELVVLDAVTLRADPDRLAQALRNLLRNALVHAAPSGVVRLTAEPRRDRVRFLVDDDGPGISADDRDRIFDRFARLDVARRRDRGGAGLGLAIVRAIALAHGGSVTVEGSPLGGARFVLELPRRSVAGRAPVTGPLR